MKKIMKAIRAADISAVNVIPASAQEVSLSAKMCARKISMRDLKMAS